MAFDYAEAEKRRVRTRESWKEWTLLALRVIIGSGFLVHGFAKLDRGPDSFAAVLK